MNRVLLLYPPGKLYQRSEDRAQCNISDSAAVSVHACNDLGYAAAVLRAEGYELLLRDYQTAGASESDALAEIAAFQPDLAVLSTTNSSVLDDLAFLDRMRAAVGKKCVCAVKGAVFYDIDPALLGDLPLSGIDCLIGTEMEFAVSAVAAHYLRHEGALSQVGGILYKQDGVFVKTLFCCGENDLDSLPFPARDLMDNSLYVRPDTGEMMATVQTALGCPSGCIYCLTPVISGKSVRRRRVENVFREIEECYYKYHIRNFFFRADTFTIDEGWAAALCDAIVASPLHGKIAFTANSRAKPLSAALLRKMKDAGCFTVAVGFESGSNETLARIKKGTTVEDNLRAAALIHAAGIPLFGFFMLGFPWETEEMIEETAALIRKTKPDFIEVHIAMPFYGTGLYRECEAAGTLSGSGFGRDVYAPNTVGTRFVPMRKLLRLKKRMLRRFYLRPSYLLRKLLPALRNPTVFANYVRYGLRLAAHMIFRGPRRDCGN